MVRPNIKMFSLLVASVALAWHGCSKILDPEEANGFGLQKVELRLTSENLGTLNSSVFARLQVPGDLKL